MLFEMLSLAIEQRNQSFNAIAELVEPMTRASMLARLKMLETRRADERTYGLIEVPATSGPGRMAISRSMADFSREPVIGTL